MILMYHNVVPSTAPKGYRFQCITMTEAEFSMQIRWLRLGYRLVSLADYLALTENERRSRKHATITFDDTTEVTVDCVARLMAERGGFPVTYFVTSGQVDGGPLFWVAYLNAICHEEIFQTLKYDGHTYALGDDDSRVKARNELMNRAIGSGNPIEYCKGLRDAYQLPETVMRYYRGITSEQLLTAGRSPWVEIAGHTVNHPILPRLAADEQRAEIVENKEFLEQKTGRSVRYMAYPFGDYDLNSIRVAEAAGFEAVFAVDPKNLQANRLYEYPRIGAYCSRNFIAKTLLYKLGLYARGK